MYMDANMMRRLIKEKIPVMVTMEHGAKYMNALILSESLDGGGAYSDVYMMQTEEGNNLILHQPGIKDIQPMKPVEGEIFSSRAFVLRLIQSRKPLNVIMTNGFQYHNVVILAEGGDAFLIQMDSGREQMVYKHSISTIRAEDPMFHLAAESGKKDGA